MAFSLVSTVDFIKSNGKASVGAVATVVGSGLKISNDMTQRQKNVATFFEQKSKALNQSLVREQRNQQGKMLVYKAKKSEKISEPDALIALNNIDKLNNKEKQIQEVLCTTSYSTYKKQDGYDFNLSPTSDAPGSGPKFGSISSQYFHKNASNTFIDFQCPEFVPVFPEPNYFVDFGLILTIFIIFFYFTNLIFTLFKIEKQFDPGFNQKYYWLLSAIAVIFLPFFLLLIFIDIIWKKLFNESENL